MIQEKTTIDAQATEIVAQRKRKLVRSASKIGAMIDPKGLPDHGALLYGVIGEDRPTRKDEDFSS
jgi:hypothetical protein